VLSGEVNPSGKLPVTFAKQQSDYPCFQYDKEGYPGVDRQVYYKEGIYVGYRYFDTKRVKPMFPFGFGLSYTSFRYGKPTTNTTTLSQDGSAVISIPITNTGKRKGKEVVELYVSQPTCSVDRPAKELKGFEKVELNPGETKMVQFTVTPRDLAYYSEALHAWKTEAGTFKVLIGASETDIRGSVSLEYK
jgi:beta-glucosidase